VLTTYCFGEAAGGQGVPDGVVPVAGCELTALLFGLFPAVEGAELELSEFDDPGVAAPGAGVDAFGVPAEPGNGPQGVPLGVVPGVF
jgi:hypothetical protein